MARFLSYSAGVWLFGYTTFVLIAAFVGIGTWLGVTNANTNSAIANLQNPPRTLRQNGTFLWAASGDGNLCSTVVSNFSVYDTTLFSILELAPPSQPLNATSSNCAGAIPVPYIYVMFTAFDPVPIEVHFLSDWGQLMSYQTAALYEAQCANINCTLGSPSDPRPAYYGYGTLFGNPTFYFQLGVASGNLLPFLFQINQTVSLFFLKS